MGKRIGQIGLVLIFLAVLFYYGKNDRIYGFEKTELSNLRVSDRKNAREETVMNKAIAGKEPGMEDFYGYYRITEFRLTSSYWAMRFDTMPIQEADMMIGRVIEIQEDMLETYTSVRRLGTREGRSAFSGNYSIETIYIENPQYQWDVFASDVAWYEDYFVYTDCESILKKYHDAIKGCISIQVTTPFGMQQYFVMSQGIIMVDSLSGMLFFLEKLDAESDGGNAAGFLTEEDKEAAIYELYGKYTIKEFLPTKYFPARDSNGDIRLPQEEADMMIGQEIMIEEGKFVTYDNFRLPNSVITERAMDDFLIEEVNIPDPDYQVTVKQRDEIYGLRDEMLPENMVQEEYIEVNVYPGYYTNGDRNLPQLYLLEDGRVIMYAMGEYFLLQKSD